MKNSYQKFTKDVISIGVTNLLLVLSTLIVIPLLTKTLGAHYFGIWSQAEVTIQLVLYIVGLGLPFALSRFLAAETNREKLQEGFYSAFRSCLGYLSCLNLANRVCQPPFHSLL